MVEIYRGIVVDNNDTDQKGKIKVRILPHFKDVEDKYLPWIKPYCQGVNSQADQGTHIIPEVDSVIRVVVASWVKKNFYWLGAEQLNEYDTYSSFTQNILSNITELGSQTYPQPNHIEVFPDGSAYFMNTKTGEKGWYHNNGCYIIFDVDGNIVLYGKDRSIKIYNNNASLEMTNTGETNIDTSGSNSTVNIITGTGTVNLDAKNVNIGGDETLTEAIIKGTTFLTELITAFNSHLHDVPQAPSGTLPSKTPTVPWIKSTNFPNSESTFNKTS